MPDSQAIVDMLAHVWAEIDGVCGELDDAAWKAPTDCPGWSVRDQISHVIGTESMLLGRPAPEHAPVQAAHVHNPMGERNEAWVDERRVWPPGRVLDEFREVTSARLGALRAMSEDDFAADSWTPVGPGTYADFMAIRVLDCWVHEQDIRRALGQPGDLDSPAAAHTVGRLLRAMPAVVAKRAGAPDGASVVYDITGAAGRTFPIGMAGERAHVLDSAPPSPTVTLAMDVETFVRLACGRGDPAALAARVEIQGDHDLGGAVLRSMNIML